MVDEFTGHYRRSSGACQNVGGGREGRAAPGEVHLSLGAGAGVGKDGLLGIRSEGKRSTTRLLDAEFPKFRQLLPDEHTAVATIDVAELTEAIKRVALVADRGAQVRMEFGDGVLRLAAGADDVGPRGGGSCRWISRGIP